MWEAHVADFGTDVLAISTSNQSLQELTQDFINFIKRCRSTYLHTHIGKYKFFLTYLK